MELHNAGSTAVNLNGFGLTDDSTKPFQFSFPSYSLLPGEKVVSGDTLFILAAASSALIFAAAVSPGPVAIFVLSCCISDESVPTTAVSSVESFF